MDVDAEHHNVDVAMLVLQQTQAVADKQSHIVNQQDMLILSQKEIQCDVQQLQILATSSQHRKRPKPHPNSLPTGDSHPDDADDEGEEGDESSDETKERLPSRFHVRLSLSTAIYSG